jgi:hypothetical protein
VAVAIQNAFNQVWGVPIARRPDPVRARVRSFLLLGLFGLGVLLTTALAALVTAGERFGAGVRVGAVVAAVALNIAKPHPDPRSGWALLPSWSPMIGNWPSALSRSCCCSAGLPGRRNPSTVEKIRRSGNSERKP